MLIHFSFAEILILTNNFSTGDWLKSVPSNHCVRDKVCEKKMENKPQISSWVKEILKISQKSNLSSSDTESETSSEISLSNSSHKSEVAQKKLKPTSKNLDFNLSYSMDRANLGQAVIFNNKNYDERIRK